MSAQKPLTAIRKILEHKYFPLAVALIAFLVSLPTIKFDLMLDDLNHRTILIDSDRVPKKLHDTGLVPEKPGTLSAALFEQFGFSRHESQMEAAKNYGILPWWTPEGMKAALWRPLSSFTHWLDYRLFPDSAPLMHVHHLLWFSAVIFLIAVLYRRLMGPTWVAALAVIFFLIDENNVFPVMFVAHRNSFIALFFGLLCLIAHHRWRKNNSRTAAIAAPIFLLLSLFSAEAGIATFAYILAYAIALEKGSLAKRAATIAPAVCIIILWRLIYNTLGYGTYNVGLYVDPVNEPVRYTLAVLERLPIMLFGVFSPIPPDFVSGMNPSATTWLMFISIASLMLLLVVMLPLLLNNRLALFFALGTVFAVVPFCACFVSSRNLLFASVPGFALIAIFITDVFKKSSYLPRALLYRMVIWIVCIGLFLTHLPGALFGRFIGQKMTSSILLSSIGPPRELIDNVRTNQSLVVINSPCALGLAWLPFVQVYEGKEPPNSLRVLAPALRPLQVRRVDKRTLIIRAKDGDIFSCGDVGPMHLAYLMKAFNDLFRNKEFSFQPSQTVTLPRLTVKVLEVDEKKATPTQVAFIFDTALEDDSLCFYRFDWWSLSHLPFKMPAIGEIIELPGPPYVSPSDAIKFIKSSGR